MEFHPDKDEVISTTRKHIPKKLYSPWERVKLMKNNGVILYSDFTHDLHRNKHIDLHHFTRNKLPKLYIVTEASTIFILNSKRINLS